MFGSVARVTLFNADELAEPPVGPTVRVRLVVAYDGSGFRGFAVNDGVHTVGGALLDAISTVLGHPVDLTVAGRTDRGVHARGQVVTFDARADVVDLPALQRSLNKMLGPDIAVRDAAVVADSFDARFSATARRYRYVVLNAPTPDPFLARTAWHVDKPLSLPNMVLACDPFVGEHDFAAFCRRPKTSDGSVASLVRRVTYAHWHDDGDGRLRFEIEANAFCHQMVRSIVGTMIDVGLGRKHAGELAGIIRSASRDGGSHLAPPHGLTLWFVRYGDWCSASEP